MARAAAVKNRRVNYQSNREMSYAGYEDGSAVRKPEAIPVPDKRAEKHRAVAHARKRALEVGRGYVVFLSIICCITLLLCVTYLQQKARITAQYEEIALLESQYTQLKRDNDAKYNEVVSSITMEYVKDAALNRLGMHYADADQIQYYNITEDSYVRQYKEVQSEG